MTEKKYFGIIDYVIFSTALAVSSTIGIYFAYKNRKKQTSAEYLLANKTMHWFPICISIVASFFSAVGVIGMPAQIYTTGVVFAFHVFSFLPVVVLSAEIFTPLFRKLNLVSSNEYLEMRYSYGIRLIGSLLTYIQYLLYLSVVLYAPSLALSSVANIPLLVTILSTGVVCTFYTALGGMRAVIWTDVFQSFVMIMGLITVVVMGVLNVGSFSKLVEKAEAFGRLEINISPNPRVYHSVWGTSVGLLFAVVGTFTVSQPTMQRVVSAKTVKHAKWALYMSFIGIFLIMSLLALATLSIFAKYADCDLLRDKRISQYDQVLPYFVINELGKFPGIPGLFTACLFSFALSTLSSGLNALSALFLEDVVKKCRPNINQRWQMRITKFVSFVGGVFVTGFAFVIPKVGKFVLQLAIQIFSIIGGPHFALFAVGLFTSRTNHIGAYCGTFVGVCTGVFLSIGQLLYPPDKQLPPISIRGCSFYDNRTSGIIHIKSPVYSEPIAAVFKISYTWHALIAITVTSVVAYIVSIFASCCVKIDRPREDVLYDYSNCFLCQLCRKGSVQSYNTDTFQREMLSKEDFPSKRLIDSRSEVPV